MLKRLLGRWSKRAEPGAPAKVAPPDLVTLPWRSGTSHPIPDWEAHTATQPADEAQRDAFWTAAAESWLVALGASFGQEFAIARSPRFLLLSNLPERRRDLVLGYGERTRKAILRNLDGIAASTGYGPHVIVVVEDADQYYDYVANYYPESGEFAYSSGMFLHAGYGHFVLIAT